MADPLYVVIGATGHIGGVLTNTLLEQRKKVRVVARSADKLQGFVERGAEAMTGNIEDAAFVKKVFAGAGAAFTLIPPNFAVRDFRQWQNRVAENLAVGIEAGGLSHVMTLSSVGAHLSRGAGPVNGLHDMEQRFNRLGKTHVLHLRPTYFMENQLTAIGMIKQMNAIGGALRPDLAMPMIATKDIGAVAGRRLSSLDWKDREVQELLGPRDVTMNEVAKAIGQAIGKSDLKYVQFSYDDSKKAMVGMGVPEEMADLYMEMTRGFNEGSIKATQTRGPKTNTPTTLEEFARATFAPAFKAS